jgi:hypothetical protein
MFGEVPDRGYARRALAEGQHVRRSPRKTPLLVIGGIVAVAALVAAIFVFSGGGDGPLGLPLGDDTPDTPEFAFKIQKGPVITTAEGADQKKAVASAAPASKAVTEVLDTLYTEAFLDPANWHDGAYDDALELFSKDARTEAEQQLELLTAGTEVSGLEEIRPMPSTLKTEVLVDPKNVPASVIGVVKFQASGIDGADRFVFSSRGQYVLEKVDGGWTIVSFSVSRADKERAAGSSSATTGSPEASAS